jgi:pimeloyl-ACP methyl ester carboxylesterase
MKTKNYLKEKNGKVVNFLIDTFLFFRVIFLASLFVIILSYTLNQSILLKNEENFTFPGNFISLNEKKEKSNVNLPTPEMDDDIHDSDYEIQDEDEDYNVETFERKKESYLHFWCEGDLNSNLTVILESDLGSNHLEWNSLMNYTFYHKENFRVCSYDRIGLGFSFSKSNNSLNEMMENLNLLLKSSGETKPFLFVGRGFGGLLLMNYMLKYGVESIHGFIFLNSFKDANLKKSEIELNEMLSNFGPTRVFGLLEYVSNKFNFSQSSGKEMIDFLDHHTTSPREIVENQKNNPTHWKSISNELKIMEEMKETLRKQSKGSLNIPVQFWNLEDSDSEFEFLFKNVNKQKINSLDSEILYSEIKNFNKK